MRLLRRAATALRSHHRRLSTAADEMFLEAWRRTVPNLEPPKTPLAFKIPQRKATSTSPKLTVNLILPYSSELSDQQVDMVVVPATTGQMGILPGHEPSISELKPGLLSVHDGEQVRKYFISSGFAFVHSNSVTDIITTEAVPFEHVDPVFVEKGLSEFSQKMGSASGDIELAEARIAVEVLTALKSAVSG